MASDDTNARLVFAHYFSRLPSPRIKDNRFSAGIPIVGKKLQATGMPTPDRVGFDIVAASHHALLDAHLVELRIRREQK